MIGIIFSRAGAHVALALLAICLIWWGIEAIRDNERARIEREAVAKAQSRIIEMENSNERFRALPARDRCLSIMRDSGLPEYHCDGR